MTGKARRKVGKKPGAIASPAAPAASASAPAAGHGVLSLLDGRGQEWHYPVLLDSERASDAAPAPLLFFQRATHGRPVVRFRQRERAVRFTQVDAELAQQSLRSIERLLNGC